MRVEEGSELRVLQVVGCKRRGSGAQALPIFESSKDFSLQGLSEGPLESREKTCVWGPPTWPWSLAL